MICARLAAVDHVHLDRLLEEHAEMEECHRTRARSIGEQGEVVAVADFSPFLVIDLLQHVRHRTGRGNIGLPRAVARLRLEKIVSERDRRIELQPIGLRAERLSESELIAAAEAAAPLSRVRRSRLSGITTSPIGRSAYVILPRQDLPSFAHRRTKVR